MTDDPLDAMKARWSYIQGFLFPWMREDNDPITEALGRLVTTLDVIGLEAFVPDPPGGPGRPPEDRRKTSSASDFSASAAHSRSNAISCSASSRSPSIRSSVSSTTGPPPPDPEGFTPARRRKIHLAQAFCKNLTGLDHEDFGEPVDVPARNFSAELEAFGSGRLGWPAAGLEGEVGRVAEWRGGAQLIEGELAHERHVLCSVALAHAREVLLEGHVERPVQRVLDAPVAADCLGEPGGGENAGSNVISRVEPGAIL